MGRGSQQTGISMRFVTVSRLSSSDTVRVTSLTTPDMDPGTGAIVGARSVEVEPSGKFHFQEVGLPTDVSLRCTARGWAGGRACVLVVHRVLQVRFQAGGIGGLVSAARASDRTQHQNAQHPHEHGQTVPRHTHRCTGRW